MGCGPRPDLANCEDFIAEAVVGLANRRILINGGGIAGLTLAWWLRRRGFEPTVLEVAPAPRAGGYMIDFWGMGIDVAERMAIMDQLRRAHVEIPSMEFVDTNDRVRARFPIRRMRESIGWRHVNLLRSSLERVLYNAVKNSVEIRFGTGVESLRDDGKGVDVTLTNGTTERWDLVVGAGGLHSHTRRLVFGPDDSYEKYLGYYTASYTMDDFIGGPKVFKTCSLPGRQAGVYSIGDGRLAAFFVFHETKTFGHLTPEAQRAKLLSVYGGDGWITPRLLQRMDRAPDFYFDAVSQIRMTPWSRGRVALVGDACQCVSLVAGQGSALAMGGAYALAGELAKAGGDHVHAFRRYEDIMTPEILRKQHLALKFASSFVPAKKFGIFVRDMVVRAMVLPGLTGLVARGAMLDSLRLPDYERVLPA